ncbi:MAG: AmmeMemoRadiSam system radical SAM enzyme [Euryarchaeota archaeon]|nr:AmmeMemoRadiSam system radical SAM enzyme [Euryarchaeota archaeon]
MEKLAMLWEARDEKKVRCGLCSHRCTIKEGRRGICGVRENRDGTLYTLNYGLTSSVAPDPIEKKPLFHFYPGTTVFSLGTVGCNFRCMHCQNYNISQRPLEEAPFLHDYPPETAVELAKDHGCAGIAWTYNEPTIWFEYTYDSAVLAKKEGLYTVYVTNGYMTEEALDTIAPHLDAMNVDVKGFTDEFYKEIASAKLAPVLETVERAVEKGIFVELTYLVIPTRNDGDEEIRRFASWVAQLDPEIPVHFSRFHPDYQMMDLPPTPVKTLERARELALESLSYVYTGNVPGDPGENTYCPDCGAELVRRWGFVVEEINLSEDCTCPGCGREISMVTAQRPGRPARRG